MIFFFQAEDGIRDLVRSRGLGDVYKRQVATRKQIADIITFYRTLVNGWAETGAGADDLPETALEESIDAILDVTLGRKQ